MLPVRCRPCGCVAARSLLIACHRKSIERFDAPKTAITTLLAGVVAGAVASMVFPVNSYHLIQVAEPGFSFGIQVKYFLLLAVIISVSGKLYSSDDRLFQTGCYATVEIVRYI